MEREKFEESWKDAFDKAEIAPSEKVWTNIELDLEKEKGSLLKRRLLFYQMLAAASVVFAMAVGAAGVYYNLIPQPDAGTLAMETPITDDTFSEPGASTSSTAPLTSSTPVTSPSSAQDAPPLNDDKNAAETNDKIPGTRETRRQNNPVATAQGGSSSGNESEKYTRKALASGSVLSADANEREALAQLPASLSERELPPLYTPREIELRMPAREERTVDPVVAMLARLEQREREVQDPKKNKKQTGDVNENLWTSIGFAAGAFNNVQSSSSPSTANTAMALVAPIVDQETKASGYTYSMGMNVGTKLSERWVLQGGLNYLTQASEYTANNVVVSNTNFQQQRFRAASTNELVNADAMDLSSKIVYSAPYNVNNSMRYLSVPLQAGYLIINKTFGLQVNAGVATDLFLQNTISADSDQLDKTSQGSGDDSPYRTLNLSGLFGTEFSYRFGEHYRIALNPGLRYPFNTIYKSDLGVQATPLTFDVGLRFRYIFH